MGLKINEYIFDKNALNNYYEKIDENKDRKKLLNYYNNKNKDEDDNDIINENNKILDLKIVINYH